MTQGYPGGDFGNEAPIVAHRERVIVDEAPMSYQERVIAEKAELDERIAKLGNFIAGGAFVGVPGAEQARLRAQANLMQQYSKILGERINEFQGV
jgi:hypothetical protein